MKSIATTQNTAAIIFPCLMIARNNGMIVLMKDDKTGVVINSGTGSENIGYIGSCWRPNAFDVYDGEVTLAN